MKCRVWLSYDLGVKGDYENMYYWLDQREAKECGDSMATFLFQYSELNNIKSEVRSSLEEVVNFSRKDRVYLIYRNPDNTYSGNFIIGTRKSSPWEGASKTSSSDDDE